MSEHKELFAIVWFEDDDVFTLVDDDDKTVLLTYSEALDESSSVLANEKEVDEAEKGIRYALPVELLDTLFGWTV